MAKATAAVEIVEAVVLASVVEAEHLASAVAGKPAAVREREAMLERA